MLRSLTLLVLLLAAPALAADEPKAGDDDDSAEAGDDDDSAEAGDDDDSAEADAPTRPTEHFDPVPEIQETIVITATGDERLLSEAPLPVRVVDAETIRRSGASDAADLLRRAPGVPVMSHGVDNRGGVSGISLQGVPAGRTLVLVDGRPVAGDVGGVVDLSQFPAEMLERVEIVEGPMSALYGSDALGGVINLITRRPAPGSTVSGRVQGSSEPSLDLGLTLSAAQPDGFQWGMNLSGRLAAPLDLDDSEPSTDLDERKALGARFFAGLHRELDRLELSAMYSHDERDGIFTRTNNAVAPPHVAVYDGLKRHDRLQGTLSWRHEFHKAVQARWELDATDYSFSFTEDLRSSPIQSIRRARTFAVDGRFRIDCRAVSWGTIVVGVEGRVEGLRVFQDRVEAGGLAVHLDEVDPRVEGSVEPWVQGDLKLFDERLELLPGVRLSIQDSYGFSAAPSLAIRLDLWKGASLRVSGGRGYRAPSLKDRYLVFDHSALGYIVYGDPQLRPESSWGANLSLDQTIGKAFSFRLGGYANRLVDLITYVFDGSSSTDGLNVYRSTNVRGAKTFGGQATAEFRLPWMHASAAYRFLWAISDDGFFLPDSPVHALRGTFEVTLVKIDLSLYNSVAWESERFVDTAQSIRSPGLVRWDIRLEKRFAGRQNLSVFIGVDNLLDQKRDPTAEGDFRPVEGRKVIGGVRGSLRFEPQR